MTTEVSSTPRLGSANGRLIHYGIEIGTEPFEVKSGSTLCGCSDHRTWHEPPWGNRSKLRHRRAVASDDKRLTGLDLSKHRGGVIAQLSLGDDSIHAGQRSRSSIS